MRMYGLIIFWCLFIFLWAYFFGSSQGIGLVMIPSISKTHIINTFANFGFFILGVSLYFLIFKKDCDKHKVISDIPIVILMLLFISFSFGRFINCDDIYKYCITDYDTETSDTCYDKQGPHEC